MAISCVARRRSDARASCTTALRCTSASVLRVFSSGFFRQPLAEAITGCLRAGVIAYAGRRSTRPVPPLLLLAEGVRKRAALAGLLGGVCADRPRRSAAG